MLQWQLHQRRDVNGQKRVTVNYVSAINSKRNERVNKNLLLAIKSRI